VSVGTIVMRGSKRGQEERLDSPPPRRRLREEGGEQQPRPDAGQSRGRERAMKDKVEHVVRNKDGEIGQRNTYGHDPRRVPR